MKPLLNRKNVELEKKLPIKVVQFGQGNFLRAFADHAFHLLNKHAGYEFGVAVIKPREKGSIEAFEKQDGLYTLFLKGLYKGETIDDHELIDTIQQIINPYKNFEAYLALAKEESLEFIISNVTESGLVYEASDTFDMKPPSSFPAKLTVFLYERFKHYNGSSAKGLAIIPCELIKDNAIILKEIILRYIDDWNLEDEFKAWILNHNSFHNTLVDRIVPGKPKNDIAFYHKQLDYQDELIVTGEPFFLWVIEGDAELKEKLPLHLTGLDVKIVKDVEPYRTLKIKILNGTHTSMVPFSILFGCETVSEAINDKFTGDFIQKLVFNEILETIDVDRDELNNYAEEMFDRFRNPFIKHYLSTIALNTASKFKLRALPSLLSYMSIHHKIPTHLVFAFACTIRFYKGTWKGKKLPVNDSDAVVAAYHEIWKLNDYAKIAREVLSNTSFWGQDLTKTMLLEDAIILALEEIDTNGIENGFINFSKKY